MVSQVFIRTKIHNIGGAKNQEAVGMSFCTFATARVVFSKLAKCDSAVCKSIPLKSYYFSTLFDCSKPLL